jgi:hypothetical protein
MTDLLERLGTELAAAERRLVAPASVVGRRRGRRATVLALVGLAAAVPALAATQPWRPILGEPSTTNIPNGVATSPPPASQTASLSVLRRPQNAADRGPIAQALLREVGAEYKGVRLASVRLLSSPDGRHHALLVPTEEHGLSSTPGRYEVSDDLCIQTRTGSGCGDASDLRLGNFLGGSGDDNLHGLVPDGVTKVVLTFSDGQVRSAGVHDNFFWVTGVPLEQRTVRVEPRGHGNPPTVTIEMPEQARIDWYDAMGSRVGPPADTR